MSAANEHINVVAQDEATAVRAEVFRATPINEKKVIEHMHKALGDYNSSNNNRSNSNDNLSANTYNDGAVYSVGNVHTAVPASPGSPQRVADGTFCAWMQFWHVVPNSPHNKPHLHTKCCVSVRELLKTIKQIHLQDHLT